MLPNRHNVYLHDTSQSELFDRTDRAFSHGCIRLERPIDLALELFRGDATWNRTRFESELSRGEEQAVRLPQPVPVHMLYWTAFVNPAGELETHQDIYEIDVRLDAALATRGCASVVGPSARDRLPSDRPACY